jgi:ring-1,2-phenylacetyl-CoA epoxidase subunit PaaC
VSTFDDDDFDDNPYDLLAQDHDAGHRWAFGTGFTDPLEGIDTSVPDGVDAAALARYCLALGDDALVYSHRLQQWVTRMPELEEETAIANIALDLLGQARMLLARAGAILGAGEDQLAFFRDEKDFRNVRLAEHADQDFAELVARLLIFSTWRLALFERLAGRGPGPAPVAGPADPVLAAIAAKGVHELAYHRDYAAQWVVRLGDGTELSHERMQRALATVWPLAGELFRPDDDALASVGPEAVDAVLDTVFAVAGLARPDAVPPSAAGAPVARDGGAGRDGVHSEGMGGLLAELQSVARAHPDATW